MSTDEAPFSDLITFLFVEDLERSSDFYANRLGLELAVEQGSCRIFRVGRDSFIGICQRSEHVGASAGVLVTLVCDDVDGWTARLQMAGVDIEEMPRANSQYGIYHAFLRDPDGHRIEIQRFDDPDWAQT